MHYNHGLQWFFIYHTVGMPWTAEAILHLGFCASAGAVCTAAGLDDLTQDELVSTICAEGAVF